MSLLTPVKEAVKIYRWDDVGAPVHSLTANNIIALFTACLSTGYGSKASAGWAAPFSNTASKAVFRIKNPNGIDSYFLRFASDTGKRVAVSVYKDMTDLDTGIATISPKTNFVYSALPPNGKWVLLATSRGFWFFAEGSTIYSSIPTNKCGSYFFAGEVPSDIGSGFFLKYTGGTYSDTDSDRRGITFQSEETTFQQTGMTLNLNNGVVGLKNPIWVFDGNSNQSSFSISSNLFVSTGGNVFMLPMHSPSVNTLENFAMVDNGDGLVAMNFCTSPKDVINNVYVPTDFWGY